MQKRNLANSPAPRLLVTAFHPFKGRSRNGSSTVLAWLRRSIAAPHHHFHILPVQWQPAPGKVRALLDRLRPDIVLHLGEGQPERIAFECIAHNEMFGTDEMGNAVSGRIDPAGPAIVRSTLKFSADWIAEVPLPVIANDDPGRFLCNRVLYETLRHFNGRAAFLHLPPQADAPSRDYNRIIGPVVRQILESNGVRIV